MNLTIPVFISRREICALVRQTILAIVAAVAFCGGVSAIESVSDAPGSADLIVESGLPNPSRGPGPVTGIFSNQVVGATRFYDAGYTGTRAVMANIEAGYIWNGHETLSHVGLISTTGTVLGEFDRHATVVGMIMGGRVGGVSPGPYQMGIAPDAQLYSGALATNWVGTRFTTSFDFNWTISQMYDPYRKAFTGVGMPNGARAVDVINSSWAGSTTFFGTAGGDQISSVLDGLANQNPHTLFVAAAGNSGAGPNQVPTPAAGYNVLSVGSVASNGGAFNTPSTFTSGGPNNYQDPINGQIANVRQVVDIVAPGENISGAYYGGETGGNRPQLGGAPSGDPGGPNWYTNSTSGTSYAAPTVSGGVALLYDASYASFPANSDARDARVMKAVVMNSAAKTLGWNNSQTANPNGSGGVITTQGLDNRVGAGRMDLNRAYDQLLGGTTDVPGTLAGTQGLVGSVGWDFGQVGENVPNDYLINSSLIAGTNFTATLDWFRDRTSISGASFSDNSYDNLDLELWSDVAGVPTTLISTSKSLYNDVEHFSFAIPATGQYTLRVLWKGEWFDTVGDLNVEHYGLAWSATVASVPEPATIVLLFSLVPFAATRRFARR